MKSTLPRETKGARLVNQIFREGFVPPEYMYCWEWADKKRILTTVSSGEPGPYRTDRTPYLREIAESLSSKVRDPKTNRWMLSHIQCVVLMKGSQLGGTDLILNWHGANMELDPGPDMIIQPTVDNAKRFSKQKLKPMITNTPGLNMLIKDSRARDSGNEILMKEYPGGFLGLGGSNSPAGLRQISVKRISCDDFDGFAPDAGGEGDPGDLIENRQATFSDSMTFLNSTPTDEETSNIARAYDQTDQRKYFVPCVKCGEFEPLTWAQIKWPQGEPLKAYLECLHCGFHMQNYHKNDFLPKGEWRPTAEPKLPGWVGYHLSALYSPHGWESWGQIAVKFIAAKGNPAKMRVWTNTKAAETFKGDGEELKPDKILERREDYTPALLPDRVVLLDCSIDVQSTWLEVQIDGYGRDKEYWNIDHKRIEGDPSVLNLKDDPNNTNVWKLALDQINRTFIHPRFGEMKILATCVDTGGDNTMKAYEFCRTIKTRRLASNVWAIKGKEGKRLVWPRQPTKRNKGKVDLYIVGVDTAKQTIYDNSKIETPGPSYRHYPLAREEDFFTQLFSERKLTYYSRGFPHHRWFLPSGKRNEALDLAAYSLAALEGLIFMGLDLNKRADKLDQQFPPGTAQARAQAQAAVKPRARRRQISSGI